MIIYTIRDRVWLPARSSTILTAALLTTLSSGAFGHDVPNDVTIQAFLKPEAQHLNCVVRLPLKAMRDVDFPPKGNGYLDLDRLAALLPDAATLWIADFTTLYEGDTRLNVPRVVASCTSLPSDKSFAILRRSYRPHYRTPAASHDESGLGSGNDGRDF